MFRNSYSDHRHPVHAIGRHGGRNHWGHGGFWGPGGGIPDARRLSAADLRLVILALLDRQPAHGYELIRLIEERSGGFYTPSPGVIYPALSYLDEIEHIAAEPEANRKRYRITEEGRRHLDANRVVAEAILDALRRVGGRMEHVREAFAGLDDADPAAADELHRARHAFKRALMRQQGCAPAEARRIAAILDRATAEILASSPASQERKPNAI